MGQHDYSYQKRGNLWYFYILILFTILK
jgi:hypothetical protein